MEKNTNLKFAFFTVLIILFAVGGYFLGKRTAETENMYRETPTKQTTPTNPETPTENTPTEVTPTETVYDLKSGYSYTTNGTTYSLYIRSDKTFRLSITGETGENYVGTYAVEKNTVTFTTKAIYHTNGCFFKKGAKALEANLFNDFTGILADSNITINRLSETMQMNYSSSLKEDSDALTTYTVNPTTGTYSDCTSNDKI